MTKYENIIKKEIISLNWKQYEKIIYKKDGKMYKAKNLIINNKTNYKSKKYIIIYFIILISIISIFLSYFTIFQNWKKITNKKELWINETIIENETKKYKNIKIKEYLLKKYINFSIKVENWIEYPSLKDLLIDQYGWNIKFYIKDLEKSNWTILENIELKWNWTYLFIPYKNINLNNIDSFKEYNKIVYKNWLIIYYEINHNWELINLKILNSEFDKKIDKILLKYKKILRKINLNFSTKKELVDFIKKIENQNFDKLELIDIIYIKIYWEIIKMSFLLN